MDSWAQNITRFIALNAIGKFCKFNCDLFSTISGVSNFENAHENKRSCKNF